MGGEVTETIPVSWLLDMLDKTATSNPDLNNAIFYVLVAWEKEKKSKDGEE